MSPAGMAAIFGLLAAAAAYGLWRDFSTGVASDDLYRFELKDSPAGYMAVTAGKIFVVGFGVAEVLHALNLCGDPMPTLRGLFG
jgi:hypothetical protein